MRNKQLKRITFVRHLEIGRCAPVRFIISVQRESAAKSCAVFYATCSPAPTSASESAEILSNSLEIPSGTIIAGTDAHTFARIDCAVFVVTLALLKLLDTAQWDRTRASQAVARAQARAHNL